MLRASQYRMTPGTSRIVYTLAGMTVSGPTRAPTPETPEDRRRMMRIIGGGKKARRKARAAAERARPRLAAPRDASRGGGARDDSLTRFITECERNRVLPLDRPASYDWADYEERPSPLAPPPDAMRSDDARDEPWAWLVIDADVFLFDGDTWRTATVIGITVTGDDSCWIIALVDVDGVALVAHIWHTDSVESVDGYIVPVHPDPRALPPTVARASIRATLAAATDAVDEAANGSPPRIVEVRTRADRDALGRARAIDLTGGDDRWTPPVARLGHGNGDASASQVNGFSAPVEATAAEEAAEEESAEEESPARPQPKSRRPWARRHSTSC
jgi:hypothetical protein